MIHPRRANGHASICRNAPIATPRRGSFQRACEGQWMSGVITRAVRRAMTSTAVAAVLCGALATGTPVAANATPDVTGMPGMLARVDDPDPGGPTNPDDPRCAATPLNPVCAGGPYDPTPPSPAGPTGPADPACVGQPDNPVCAGGPFAPPAPPAGVPTGPADPACIGSGNAVCAGGPYAPPPPPPPPVAPPPLADPVTGMPGGIGGRPGGMGDGMPRDIGGIDRIGGGMHDR